jgi:hypothetical protein
VDDINIAFRKWKQNVGVCGWLVGNKRRKLSKIFAMGSRNIISKISDAASQAPKGEGITLRENTAE